MLDSLAPSRILDTDGQLLDALKEGSEELKNITDLFTPMMKRFRLYFFWEQEKTNLGHTSDYVSWRCGLFSHALVGHTQEMSPDGC